MLSQDGPEGEEVPGVSPAKALCDWLHHPMTTNILIPVAMVTDRSGHPLHEFQDYWLATHMETVPVVAVRGHSLSVLPAVEGLGYTRVQPGVGLGGVDTDGGGADENCDVDVEGMERARGALVAAEARLARGMAEGRVTSGYGSARSDGALQVRGAI